MRFDDLEAIADAAEAGYGLAWLPCWLIREKVRLGMLVPLLGNVPRRVFRTHAIWPETPHLPLRVRLAIDALAAALPRKCGAVTATKGRGTDHRSASRSCLAHQPSA